ncbi:unnamed protein product [Aphanomyces euteiches]
MESSIHDLVHAMEQEETQPQQQQQQQLLSETGKKKRKLKKCIVHGCTSGARSRGLCKAHGGGKRCGTEGCNLSDQGGGYCIRHGGGKRCEYDGCDKSAQSKRFCKAHGGGVRCDVPGCVKSSQGGGKCRAHGGGPKWMRSLSCGSSTSGDDASGSETPPPQTHNSTINPRLSFSVIEKFKSKNVATMSPLRKDMFPTLKTPMESSATFSRMTLPPLSIALQDKSFKQEDTSSSCIYPTCKAESTSHTGFCAFHSSQFCCQVAGCSDKRLRGTNFCASHHASATLAKCLLHLKPN